MDVAHCYLEGNADAVEFCPHNGHHNVLAASTYTLQEGDQPTRCGSISLFNVDGDTDNFETVYSEETSGIFDIKWNPPSGNTSPFLGQADADGYLRIKRLDGCCDGVEDMNIDKEVNYVAGSDASFSMAENQSQNSPPTPTTNQPQTIDLDKQEGYNVQHKKKRKVGEADESKADDSNAGDSEIDPIPQVNEGLSDIESD